jgi:UDP-N-acetylmuramoyl-tripeptide--D-alanyl-D-alanine ligase
MYLIFSISLIFTAILASYFILNLQWYDYRLKRVIFNHHKIYWHFIYFVIPLALSWFIDLFIITIVYIFLFGIWYYKLDKKLIFTPRVIRFFVIWILLFMASVVLAWIINININNTKLFLPSLLLAHFLSISLEYVFFVLYKNKAKQKLNTYTNKNNGLKIITITASYGKTSIKNYLKEILKTKYKVRATPKSVNTIKGIIKDINENLSSNDDIYIVEAGAREKNDINEIATFLNAPYGIIGKIGEAHIEYFKNLNNIKSTKSKLLNSNKLKKAFVDSSLGIENMADIKNKFANKDINLISIFDKNKDIKNIKSDLDSLSFELNCETNKKKFSKFSTNILGSFNVINLSLAILMAKELGLNVDDIVLNVAKLKNTPHRLQKISDSANGGKTIIDDSYNGNLEGMCEGVKLCATHPKDMGDKIILTCGIIESTKENNTKLAKLINEHFDLVIVTSAINLDIFKKCIDDDKLMFLKDKNKMQEIISENTKNGDLVLFLNDAPSYV